MKLFGVLGLITLFGLFSGLAVMYLVNYVFPSTVILAVFGVSHLGFWKAYALAVLFGILFKSTGSSFVESKNSKRNSIRN